MKTPPRLGPATDRRSCLAPQSRGHLTRPAGYANKYARQTRAIRGRQPVLVLLRRNALIGGNRSGKSGVLNMILAFRRPGSTSSSGAWSGKEAWSYSPARIPGPAGNHAEAVELSQDATRQLDNKRAADLTRQGSQLLTPAHNTPALITVVDECTEMPPRAPAYADSLAGAAGPWRVSLLAATQQPAASHGRHRRPLSDRRAHVPASP